MNQLANLPKRPNLLTPNLLLRHPIQSDAANIIKIAGNLDVARYLARVPHPYTASDAKFFLDHVVPSEWVWAVTTRVSCELIGVVGLTPGNREDVAELGYWLTPSSWGKGIMSECAHEVVSFGKSVLGLRRLEASYFEGNVASARVLEKLGFVECGRQDQLCVALDRTLPSVKMRLAVA